MSNYREKETMLTREKHPFTSTFDATNEAWASVALLVARYVR